MCTVTFIAESNGYLLGMNRDEQLTRVDGLPPKLNRIGGRAVLFPSEPSGGTWIAVNETGVSLALINWYPVTRRVEHGSTSRGEVVRTIGASETVDETEIGLNRLSLNRINPFRLIGFYPASGDVIEWRWNLDQLVRIRTSWKTQQWVSSGLDEPLAQRMRGEEFRRALDETTKPGLSWLRKLHSSHHPDVGPFSTCMHRADAATVSYTQITVSERVAMMHYHAGAPCSQVAGRNIDASLSIRRKEPKADEANHHRLIRGSCSPQCVDVA